MPRGVSDTNRTDPCRRDCNTLSHSLPPFRSSHLMLIPAPCSYTFPPGPLIFERLCQDWNDCCSQHSEGSPRAEGTDAAHLHHSFGCVYLRLSHLRRAGAVPLSCASAVRALYRAFPE